METDLFYLEQLDSSINSYELKMFRVQHEETQLSSYLKKYARTHQENSINKIYYKERLGFKEMSNIDDKQFFEYAAPNYDEGCKFLYFPL